MGDAAAALIHQLRAGDVVLGMVFFLFGSWAICRLLWLTGVIAPSRWGDRYARFASQIGLLLALEQAYEFVRGQLPYYQAIAYTHAYHLMDLEWRHGLFIEARVERFFLQFPQLMLGIDLFYVLGHLVITIAVIAWIYGRRGEHYPFVRNLLVLTTAIALVAYYLYPTAPPRLLSNYGFVDPTIANHLVGPGGAQPDSYTYNPYAAMPSLHVAYAIVVAWGLLLCERSRIVRLLAVLYPLAMSAAVIISGNHWLLDVCGAFITVAAAGACLLTASGLQPLLSAVAYRLFLATRALRASPVE